MLNEFAPERVTFFDANFEFYYGETHYSSDLFQTKFEPQYADRNYVIKTNSTQHFDE